MAEKRFVSYAQNMEDVMLWRALRDSVGGTGFYVDAGAADPTLLSVTRAFYDRGWRGLNIEPLPEQAERLREARSRDVVVQAALSDRVGPPQPFYRVIQSDQSGLSTTDREEAERHRAAGASIETIEVPVSTLADVCTAHIDGPVHFLKIDVEGAEAAVLAGADFERVRPWIVLVEATQPLDQTAADLGWEPGLLAARYRFVWFDGLNRFYLAEEHAELARHFKVQPNVFDNFTVYDGPLQAHLAAVARLADRRMAVLEELDVEIADLRRELESANAPPTSEPPTPLSGLPALGAATGTSTEPPSRPGRSMVRRAIFLLYAPVRPILRPLVWRFRSFMVGPLQQELFEHRLRLDHLMAHQSAAITPDERLVSGIEAVLMTLAVENGRTPSPFIPAASERKTPCSAAQKPGQDSLPKASVAG